MATARPDRVLVSAPANMDSIPSRPGSLAMALVSAALSTLPSMKPALTTNFLERSPSWYLHRMRAAAIGSSAVANATAVSPVKFGQTLDGGILDSQTEHGVLDDHILNASLTQLLAQLGVVLDGDTA